MELPWTEMFRLTGGAEQAHNFPRRLAGQSLRAESDKPENAAMRTSLASIRTAVAAGSAAAITLTGASAFGVVAFDNTARQQPLYLPYAVATEYGDEYRLDAASLGIALDSVAIQYYSNSGTGQLKLRVYDNTGPLVGPSPAPGAAPLLETLWKPLSLDANGWGTVSLTDLAPNGIILGNRLTLSLEFQNLGVNQVVGWGLSISEPDNTTTPEDVGWSPNDYWQRGPGAVPWNLFSGPKSGGGQPYDFTARITAVPEGSTWLSIAGVAALAGFGAYRRFRK